MFIKITLNQVNGPSGAFAATLRGEFPNEQIHVNANDISTVSFYDGSAQVELASGRLLKVQVPEEIAQLLDLVEGKGKGNAAPDLVAAVSALVGQDAHLVQTRML
jgi:hypothetical protein